MLDYLDSGYSMVKITTSRMQEQLEHESSDLLVDRQIRKAVVTALKHCSEIVHNLENLIATISGIVRGSLLKGNK